MKLDFKIMRGGRFTRKSKLSKPMGAEIGWTLGEPCAESQSITPPSRSPSVGG